MGDGSLIRSSQCLEGLEQGQNITALCKPSPGSSHHHMRIAHAPGGTTIFPLFLGLESSTLACASCPLDWLFASLFPPLVPTTRLHRSFFYFWNLLLHSSIHAPLFVSPTCACLSIPKATRRAKPPLALYSCHASDFTRIPCLRTASHAMFAPV